MRIEIMTHDRNESSYFVIGKIYDTLRLLELNELLMGMVKIL